MSKFLEGIEQNIPEKDIDLLTSGKRALQRYLMSKGIDVTARVFADEITIKLDDGRIIKLEVKDVRAPTEDGEDPSATINTITAIASMPDQGLGKQLMSSTARKLQMAKRKMAAAAEKIADKFEKSA
jgi:hypothetical protein